MLMLPPSAPSFNSSSLSPAVTGAFTFFPGIMKGETAMPIARFFCLFVSLALSFVMVHLCFTMYSI